MPTLDEAKKLIRELAEDKGWGTNPATKIYYAMIELGEAGDLWKHRDDHDYLLRLGLTPKDVPHAVGIELIDAIFYCLHGMLCIDPDISVDAMFMSKLKVNIERKRIYADDTAPHKE